MKNSWLSFTIPSHLRDSLAIICQNIALKTKFKPMAHEKIHMTAVFLGKTHVLPDVFDHIVSRSHDLTGAF